MKLLTRGWGGRSVGKAWSRYADPRWPALNKGIDAPIEAGAFAGPLCSDGECGPPDGADCLLQGSSLLKG
jgi:hypothetical protein